MKAAIYARKSSESEDRQVQSIDDQVRALRTLAKQEGVSVGKTITESKSAKEPYIRPEFTRLVGMIQSGEIDCLFIWSVNRISRNQLDGGIIGHLLQSGRLKALHTIDKTYYPEDSALLFAIENGMATSFIQDLRRNVKRGLQGKIDRGWFPGKAPIGYLNNPITREIDIDPVRFPLVRKAWDLLLSGGYTPAEIHRILLKLGLDSLDPRSGTKQFARSGLYRVFDNPFFMGSFEIRGKLYPGKHTPMVTADEFDRAQRILERRPDRRPKRQVFTFGGMLRCGNCGCQIVGERKRKTYVKTGREVIYTYYHCTNGKRICSTRSATEETLQHQFEQAFARIQLPASFVAWANEEVARQGDRQIAEASSSAVSTAQEIGRLTTRLDRIKEHMLEGKLAVEEYTELKAELTSRIEAVSGRVAEIQSREDRTRRIIRENLGVAEAAREYPALAEDLKRGRVGALGSNHYVTLGKLEISLHPILRKITGLEPLKRGSQMPKPGVLVSTHSRWYRFIEDIRKIAQTCNIH